VKRKVRLLHYALNPDVNANQEQADAA